MCHPPIRILGSFVPLYTVVCTHAQQHLVCAHAQQLAKSVDRPLERHTHRRSVLLSPMITPRSASSMAPRSEIESPTYTLMPAGIDSKKSSSSNGTSFAFPHPFTHKRKEKPFKASSGISRGRAVCEANCKWLLIERKITPSGVRMASTMHPSRSSPCTL